MAASVPSTTGIERTSPVPAKPDFMALMRYRLRLIHKGARVTHSFTSPNDTNAIAWAKAYVYDYLQAYGRNRQMVLYEANLVVYRLPSGVKIYPPTKH